ncbi:MAG: hypothetical protein ABL888_03585 [Pirellulaceae bacterium]
MECPKCQHSLEIPKLRDFASLSATTDSQPQAAAKISHPLRPWFFVIGLGALVLCGITGYLLLDYANGMMRLGERYTESVAPPFFDDRSNDELWASWYEFFEQNRDLPPWQPSKIKLTYDQGVLFQYIAYGLFALAAIGMVLMICSFVLPDQAVRLRKVAKR